VSGKELGHTEGTNAVGSKNLCHFLVGVEELFVFGVLEIVLLDVCPKLFDAFSTASLFFLPTTSARSALSFMGLVSPAPLGILDVFLLDVG
jgi:hypothetical protein